MRRIAALVALLASSLLTLACPPAHAAAQRCVTIASTNDMHGALDPHVLEASGKKLRYGGMLVLASYLDALRARYGKSVLLVDAGDIYQGSLVSNLSFGRASIAAMNALGYDAAAIGNHEFDFGAGDSLVTSPGPLAKNGRDPLAVVKARIGDARFPFLAANVLERSSGKLLSWRNTRPTLLLDKGGVKVGLIGVATPETPRTTRFQNVTSLDFTDPVGPVTAAAHDLRGAGAELVVVVAHMGGECKSTSDAQDVSSCEQDSDLFDLVRRLPPGTVDVVIGGHTHQFVAHWVKGVAVTEAGARVRNLGYIEACVKPGGGIDEAASRIHAPVPLCLDTWSDGTCQPKPVAGELKPATFLGRTIAPSAALAKVVAPYQSEVKAAAERHIGARLDAPLAVRGPGGASPLGDALIEAMKSTGGATIAVQNRGGMRSDLPAGDLTYSEVFECMPFDNRVAVMELTASELEAFLGVLFDRPIGGPIVSGLEVKRTAEGLSVREPDGSPLRPGRSYKLATNDYLAQGGEGAAKVLAKVPPERIQVLDIEVRAAFVDYLRKRYGTRD